MFKFNLISLENCGQKIFDIHYLLQKTTQVPNTKFHAIKYNKYSKQNIYIEHLQTSFFCKFYLILVGVSNDISREDEIPFSPRFSTTFNTIFENILFILYTNLLYEHLS